MASKNSRNSLRTDTLVFKYALSCCGATVAESVTYPLDLVKTRLQIQGEGGVMTMKKRGMINTAKGIVREEGFTKLWQGVPPAIYRHLIYTGCCLTFYEVLRDNLLGKNPDGTFPFWKAVISGLSAGAMAQFIASPTDLVKVQMQMEGRRRLEGKPPRVKNTLHAFRKTMHEGGIRGLWRGCVPNVQRAALVNLGELATYDIAKRQILQRTQLVDNWITHTFASVCAGFMGAVFGTPADVVKTRYMNQPFDKNGRGKLYESSIDCLKKTVSKEGFLALYKGFIPIWSRMAPWSLTFWVMYEWVRSLAGAEGF